MTAEALAGVLKLPLFVIRLEGLITRYLGETAAKLRLVFDETAILDERNTIKTRDIVNALNERRTMREAFIGAQGSR